MVTMRYLVIATSIVLSSCASPAKDACKLLDASSAASIMGSEVTKMELDKGIDNGRLTSSACMINFRNGEFARLTVAEYSDLEYLHQMRDGWDRFNPRQEDAEMTKNLGHRSHYASESEFLSVDLAENKFLTINFDNRGSPATTSTTVGSNGYSIQFKHPKVKNAREKIRKLAQTVSF